MTHPRFFAFLVVILIAQSVFADIDDDLYTAVEAENVAEVTRLIFAGADVDKIHTLLYFVGQASTHDRTGTVLIKATEIENVPIVKILVEAGSDLNKTTRSTSDPASLTALITAARVEIGNVEIVRILVQAGADVNTTDDTGNNALTLAIPRYRQIETESQNRQLEICRLLIANGIDIGRKTHGGRTALMMAAQVGF